MIKVRVKAKTDLIRFFTVRDSDLNDSVNKEYLAMSSKKITLVGYCEEEDMFTCKEYPEFAIPAEFIGSRVDAELTEEDFGEGGTFVEIGRFFGVTSEAVRASFKKALVKIEKTIRSNKEYMETFDV